MVIAGVHSGLGNQLFQYAMGRRLAIRRTATLKLDLEWFRTSQANALPNAASRSYSLDKFNIVAAEATPAEIDRFTLRHLRRFNPRRLRGVWWRFLRRHFPSWCFGMRIIEFNHNFQPGLLHLPGHVYLDGWWQSEKYFYDVAAQLRAELTLRDVSIAEYADDYIQRVRRDDRRPLVAVQVRRGDVARAHETLDDLTHMPYELVSREYLRTAMSTFGQDATFLVFSDTAKDLDWCRANLKAGDIHFVSGHDDLHDFAIMSRCAHQIISNSSFGWWAAWLNPNPDKTVIAPRRWFRRQYAADHDIHSLIPPQWILM